MPNRKPAKQSAPPRPVEEFFRLPRAEYLIEDLQSGATKNLGDWVQNQREESADRFTLAMEDDLMKGAGIQCGDYVVIHKERDFNEGDILAVQLGDKTIVRRYFRAAERIRLECDPASRQTIIVEKSTPGFQILGRVVQIIREI